MMWNVMKKDEDGNKYNIRIYFRNKQLVIDDVGFIPKGKRKPTYLAGELTNDFGWRALDGVGRRNAKIEAILKVTPKHLLSEALNDVWTSLQPTEIPFN